MLAADAQMDVGVSGTAPAAGVGNQTAYAVLVQTGEGVLLVDLLLVVGLQEFARVVPAEAEYQLGQVVGAEREEIGVSISSAHMAARGISIMLPTLYFILEPASLIRASATSVTMFFT